MTNSQDQDSLRILMLAEDFYPKTSGGAFTDWNFAKLSTERGHQVTVYTPRTSGTPERESVHNVEINRPYRATPTENHPNSVYGVFRRLLFILLLTVRLAYEIRTTNYDVIYSTNHLLHPTAKLIGLLYSLPVVNFVGYSPSERTELHPLDFRNLFEFVIFFLFMGGFVLCRTPRVRDRIEKWSRSSVEIIHGIIEQDALAEAAESDVEPVRREHGVDSKESLIVSVCRFVPVKRPEESVRVLSELPDSYRLVVLGDGEYRSVVESAVLKFDVEERVDLLGRRPHGETLRTISAADALLVTSSVEAYPTVVFEALSLNTPVVSTPVGILPEIEHPKLKLTDLSSMPQTVLDIAESSHNGLDEETVYRFSIEQFIDTVLDTMEYATRSNTQTQ
ncbi:glycosyltransferase [Halorubrum sp. SS5]|nr:glycosyltransferase [Halorubrum sp. SS5]